MNQVSLSLPKCGYQKPLFILNTIWTDDRQTEALHAPFASTTQRWYLKPNSNKRGGGVKARVNFSWTITFTVGQLPLSSLFQVYSLPIPISGRISPQPPPPSPSWITYHTVWPLIQSSKNSLIILTNYDTSPDNKLMLSSATCWQCV